MTLKKITRSICCIVPYPISTSLNDIILDLNLGTINQKLREANSKLKKALKTQELPNIIIKKINIRNENDIYSEENSSEIRFVIHDQYSQPDGSQLCSKNSHVVEISTSIIPEQKSTSFDYRYYANIDTFQSVIIDVMMDIQMFYYYSLDNIYITIKERRDFSITKVNFCKNEVSNLMPKENNIFEKYCSIAFYCRNDNNSFDYNKYVSLWASLVNNIYTNLPSIINTDTINYIFNCHPYRYQLSMKKIEHLLRNCVEGETYELIHVHKKPKTRKIKKELAALLGKEKIKVGTIKIVPLKLKYSYIKAKTYIDTFEFIYHKLDT